MNKPFTEKEKEKIREKLLKKGFEIFQDKGYKETKILDITKSVGIAKGSFYLFFDSKEEYIIEVLQWQYNLFYKEIDEEMLRKDISQEDKIKNIVANIPRNKKYHLLFLTTHEQLEVKNNISLENYNKFEEKQKDFYKNIIEKLGKDPKKCNPMIVGNLAMNLIALINSRNVIPFLFDSNIEETILIQENNLVDYILKN